MRTFSRESKLKAFTLPKNIDGHFYFFGRIGSGKSVSMKVCAEFYHDAYQFKIWDLYGGDRNEGLFWALPSDDKTYWNRFRLLGSPSEPGPKQYDIHFIYPFFKQTLPKRIPQKLPHVKSSVFTIPIKDVTIDDLKAVLGNVSDRDRYIWNLVLDKLTRKSQFIEAVELAEKKRASSFNVYRNFILPLAKQNFLADSYNDLNIDIQEEAKSKSSITVLCLDFVPKDFKVFIISYFCRKIKELLQTSSIPKKNIILIREAATFFRATEDSIFDENLKIFRQQMSEYIRYGRNGMYFFLDCQSPYETKGLVSGNEDMLIMCKMTSFRDKEEITAELRRERRMRPDQVGNLAFLSPGEAYVAESGRIVKRVKFTKPRSLFWEKRHGDFYRGLWEGKGGSWKLTEEFKDYLDEKIKERIGMLSAKVGNKQGLTENEPIEEAEIVTKPVLMPKDMGSHLEEEPDEKVVIAEGYEPEPQPSPESKPMPPTPLIIPQAQPARRPGFLLKNRALAHLKNARTK